jgi:hypothetical protein
MANQESSALRAVKGRTPSPRFQGLLAPATCQGDHPRFLRTKRLRRARAPVGVVRLEIAVKSARLSDSVVLVNSPGVGSTSFTLITDDLRSYGAAAHDLPAMSAVGGRTTAPRIRVNRPDAGSARCSASIARAQRKDFSPLTLPSSTPSTSNAVSLPLQRIRIFRAAAMTTWREAVTAA